MPSHEELQSAEKDLNHILMVKAYLGGVQAIHETLEVAGCTSQLCKWVLERCRRENTAPIASLIEETIEQDAIYSKAPIDIRNNRMWAIKVGASPKPLALPCLLMIFTRRLNPTASSRVLVRCTGTVQTTCTSMWKRLAERFKVCGISTSLLSRTF
jgi:hypothetical protein